eukprot:13693920-Ditylum_brightwellii.AAC.1
MSRRSKTKLPVCKVDRCLVFFVIGYDKKSYYIKDGYGNNSHNNHFFHKYDNASFAPSKLMNMTQQSIVKLSDPSKGRNCYDLDMVNASDNLKLSKKQAVYLKRLVKQVGHLDALDVEKSNTHQLVNHFESLKDC